MTTTREFNAQVDLEARRIDAIAKLDEAMERLAGRGWHPIAPQDAAAAHAACHDAREIIWGMDV